VLVGVEFFDAEGVRVWHGTGLTEIFLRTGLTG
jgi:hypothetical protein